MPKRILKPLDFAGLLDETFDLYKKNFLLLVAINAVYAPFSVYTLVTLNPKSPNFYSYFSWLLVPFIHAASVKAISETYLKRKPGFAEVYKAAFRMGLPLFVTMLIEWFAIVIGTVMCLIPGIIAGVWLAFVSQAIVVEDKKYIEAIKRSKNLSHGEVKRVLLTYGAIFIVTIGLQFALSIPADIISKGHYSYMHQYPYTTLGIIARIIPSLFVAPIFNIAITLLYYDIRVRKEGFDIQLLAGNMGVEWKPEMPITETEIEEESKPINIPRVLKPLLSLDTEEDMQKLDEEAETT
jgi:hypothetical protein